MKKLLVSSGGTAGHINPAINISKKLQNAGWEIHFMGNKNSLEEYLVSKTDFHFYSLDVQKIYRNLTWKHIKFPFKLLRSINTSLSTIKAISPKVFLGCGGFVCGPPGYAAHLRKIPIVLQEQNSFPGLTTRLLSKWADKVFLGNEDAKRYLKYHNLEYSGNPIDINYRANDKISDDCNTIFLLGGSQGSKALNDLMLSACNQLLMKGFRIIWQTGRNHLKNIKKEMGDLKNLTLFDYSTEIGKYFQKADFVIARAGAITLAELETLKLPSILVPLPTSAENHQYYNAVQQAEKGLAIVIQQKDLTAELLLKQVDFMQKNIMDFRSRFSESIHLNAADKIAAFIDKNYGG